MSRKFRIDFFKKLQFWVGLFLAGAVVVVAFVGFQVLNPPPTKVLICRQNIPPYTPITADMFAVDSQHLNHSVAARYVTAGELEAYIAAGAVTIEPLYAGDPLTKARLAAGPDANRFKRVSLALDDPDLVIRTIPVSPDICPEVAPGDVVELIFSLSSGQMPEQITYTPAVTGTVSLLPTPTPLPYIEMVEEITLDLPISPVAGDTAQPAVEGHHFVGLDQYPLDILAAGAALLQGGLVGVTVHAATGEWRGVGKMRPRRSRFCVRRDRLHRRIEHQAEDDGQHGQS